MMLVIKIAKLAIHQILGHILLALVSVRTDIMMTELITLSVSLVIFLGT